MRKDSTETGELSLLKLWHRASRQGDLQARSAFQLDMEGTLLNWFHAYPGSEEASCVQSDREFVAQAFEQLWQRVVQGKVACETIPEVVAYLRASLCGAILETLRVTRLPGKV